MSIASNFQAVEARISRACVRANRSRSEITLVAVSKKHPASDIIQALQTTSLLNFGENYVQEYVDKRLALQNYPQAAFHFIGHLQKNKVRALLNLPPFLIHSVDSPQLAQAIDHHIAQTAPDYHQNILIELRIGDEHTQKTGIDPQNLPQMLLTIDSCPHLRLLGLMLIPPVTDSPEQARPYFQKVHALFDECNRQRSQKLSILSYGMSADFEVAIEEGATHVRIGTAIFGARQA